MSWLTFYNYLKGKPHSFSLIKYKTITVKLSTEIAVIETILVLDDSVDWKKQMTGMFLENDRSRFTGSAVFDIILQMFLSSHLTLAICSRGLQELLLTYRGRQGKQTIIFNEPYVGIQDWYDGDEPACLPHYLVFYCRKYGQITFRHSII